LKLQYRGKWYLSITMAGLMTVVALSLLSVNSHASSPTILAVNPVEAPNNFDVTVVITGSDFQTTPAPVVRLGDNPLDLQGEPTGQLLTATVPWGLEPGVYDLSIENADGGSATLTEAFTVTAALGVWVTGGPYGGAIKRLAVSESDPATVFGNLEMIGLVRSDDAGEQWRNLSGGYVTTFALKPGDPQTVYLSAQWDNSSWLLRSSDGGQTWDPLLEMRPWALGVTPADPEVLYFGVKRWSPGPAITRTLNGGNDWETASGGIPQDAWVQALAVHPVTPNIAYAGLASGHVYKTVNGGADWTATIANFGETWWKELVVDPHNPERVYGTGWHGSEFAATRSPLCPGHRDPSHSFGNSVCPDHQRNREQHRCGADVGAFLRGWGFLVLGARSADGVSTLHGSCWRCLCTQ